MDPQQPITNEEIVRPTSFQRQPTASIIPLIAVGFLLLIAAAAGGYLLGKKASAVPTKSAEVVPTIHTVLLSVTPRGKSANSASSSTASAAASTGWKEFTSSKYHYSFKYPDNWFLKISPDGENHVEVSNYDPGVMLNEQKNKVLFSIGASPATSLSPKAWIDKENERCSKAACAPSPPRYMGEITINGHVGAVADESYPGPLNGKVEAYYFSDKDVLYHVMFQYGYNSDADIETSTNSILSTLTFD